MGKIYSTQTDLTIVLNTGKNLSNISLALIEALTPQKILRTFTAVVIDASKGIIQYAVTNENDFKEVGEWTIWAKIIDNSGLVSIGEASKFLVNKKGE
jgi:hypothetical protein